MKKRIENTTSTNVANMTNATTETYSLGDLISAISSYAKDDYETAEAVSDLFATGRVKFVRNNRPAGKTKIPAALTSVRR